MSGNSPFFRLAVGFFFLAALISCKKEVLPEEQTTMLHELELALPPHFPPVQKDPDNPLTEEGVELGRMLFYDVRLSGNNRISCASCHHQELAFSDGIALSNKGASGIVLPRHAPALFNLAWVKQGLFWDGGAKNLESQAFGPLTSEDEMHQDLYELERELKAIPDYVSRFKQVFKQEIRSADVVKALSQFQRTLISVDSGYDQYIRKEVSLSSTELNGMNLVLEKCSACHTGPLFTDQGFHNNGLDLVFGEEKEGIYQGHFRVSFKPEDMGKFKTPSLRNVLLTAPYMHDGRLKTIEEVLEHYNSGLKTSATLDPGLYQNHGAAGIPLNETEKKEIIAFLATLNDESFVRNKKQGNPLTL